jgi:hypothetical protein
MSMTSIFSYFIDEVENDEINKSHYEIDILDLLNE